MRRSSKSSCSGSVRSTPTRPSLATACRDLRSPRVCVGRGAATFRYECRQWVDATRSGFRSGGGRALEGGGPGLERDGPALWAGSVPTGFCGSFLPLSVSKSPKNRMAPCRAAIWAGIVSESETIPALIRIPPRSRFSRPSRRSRPTVPSRLPLCERPAAGLTVFWSGRITVHASPARTIRVNPGNDPGSCRTVARSTHTNPTACRDLGGIRICAASVQPGPPLQVLFDHPERHVD